MKIKKTSLALLMVVALSLSTRADNTWMGYHWARTTPSFDLTVVNSTTDDWDTYVAAAVSDWSASAVLNLVQDLNGSTSKKVRNRCSAPEGKVRICNDKYGQNNWLGIAGIWVSPDGHITKGYTKLNDTYFNWAYYDDPLWKESVACQELGHNVGLSHQDEDFNNVSLFSCMDYQDPPFTDPNPHDYLTLETLYGHPDSYDSYDVGDTGGGGGGGGGCNAPPGRGCNKAGVGESNSDNGWGVSLGRRGRAETFVREEGNGHRMITFVTWVDGHDH